MSTLFNQIIAKTRLKQLTKRIIFTCLVMLPVVSLSQFAPVRINVVITPPYSTKLSDYTSRPDKVLVSLQNLSPDASTLKIYLHAELSGQSGIRIFTNPNYKPTSPITLQAGIPYTLTLNNIEEIFTGSQLSLEGITEYELIYGNGLPEDEYTICMQAFDFETDRPLSDEPPFGCSSPMIIGYFEPPIITSPWCNEEVEATEPQNIIFSWIRPAGTPLNIFYRFKMVEVFPPETDINDAMNSASHPIFFETDVPSNSFIYGPAQPALVNGKTYAFQVTAIDPTGQTSFRNEGKSEVCSFTYVEDESVYPQIDPTPDLPVVIIPPNVLPDDFELSPPTQITGNLMIKFPTNPHDSVYIGDFPGLGGGVIPGLPPSGQIEIPGYYTGGTGGGFNYNQINIVANTIGSNINLHNNSNGNQQGSGSVNTPFINENFGWGLPLIDLMNTKKYVFENTENKQHTKPLANMQIRLVARFASFEELDYTLAEHSFGVEHPTYDVNLSTGGASFYHGLDLTHTYYGDGFRYLNIVLDETITDEFGNFSFDFTNKFWTGLLKVDAIDGHNVPSGGTQMPGQGFFNPINSIVFPGAGMNPGQFNPGTGKSNIFGEHAPQKVNVHAAPPDLISGHSHYGYVCLKIEVVNQKFASPDIDIFAMPGDNIHLPTQMAKLKTYNMIVQVKANDEPEQIRPGNSSIPGARVSIFRDYGKVEQEVPAIIKYEGQKLDSRTYVNNTEFKDVAVDTTDVNGKAVFLNLVRHAYINPQYKIQILTRAGELVDTDYENTFYNYRERLEKLSDDQVSAIQTSADKVLYNHQYTIPIITREYVLKPLPPEIKGRTMAMSNLENIGMPGVTIKLLNQNGDGYLNNHLQFLIRCNTMEQTIPSMENGFFRFPNLPIKDNNGQYFYRRLWITHPLYKSRIYPPIGTQDLGGQKPYKLLLGELVDIKDVNLEPKELVNGYVEDEDGNPVTAYVRSGDSPYYKTELKQVIINPFPPAITVIHETFSVPAEPLEIVDLEVRPLSTKYFPQDTSYYPEQKAAKITVYHRLHRPEVTVLNEQGQPVFGATVNIGGFEAKTNNLGVARFKFAAAADQFILKITPSPAYAPIQVPVEIPVSKHTMALDPFILKKAKSLQGRVTAQSGFLPIEGALVFSELVTTDGSPLYIEATTNEQGNYLLQGIPNDMTGLLVQVIKEGSNPSYIGTTEYIEYPQTNPLRPMTKNFSLQVMTDWDLASLWKYPIAVTDFTERSEPGESEISYFISGYLTSPKPIGDLSVLQNDLKIPFAGVQVTKGNDNKPEPLANKILLEAMEIPLHVGQSYTATLYNYGNANLYGIFPKKLIELSKITAGLGGGLIEGHLKLNLSSFELEYQFSGQLFLGDDTTYSRITAFNTAFPYPQQNIRYPVFSISRFLNPVPVKSYKVFGFNASSDLSNSFLQNDVIRLKTVLHTQIPGGGPNSTLDLKIPAGSLVIKNTEINFEETPSSSLTFDLEKWKVHTTKPWRFDINENAIVLPEVLIITGQGVDAKVKNMKVRPTSLHEGQIQLEGGLTLGGIANVELSGSLEPVFNFDSSIGHYRISLVGSGDAVAGVVKNLMHTEPPRLEFESIGMLSNQTEAITINQTLRFYKVVDIPIQSIMTGPGFFSLKGSPELNIPGFSPPNTVVNFTKNKNKLMPQIDPLQGIIQAYGNVEFKLMHDFDRQVFKPDLYTSYGTISIKPAADEEEGPPVTFTGFLTKTPTACNIEIIKIDNNHFKGNTMQQMPAGINSMPVKEGSMHVVDNKWDILSYKAYTSSIEGLEEKLLDFKVYGAIDVSGDDIKVNNINTPLGGLSMVYDFRNGSLFGSLNMRYLPLGFATIYEGTASVRFDNNGYYFLLHLKHFGLGPGGGMPGFKGAFLVGKASPINPADLEPIQNNFRYNMPNFNSFAGLYVMGEKEIVNISINIIKNVLPIVDIHTAAGLGMFVNANFGQSTFAIGGYGYGKFKGSKIYTVEGLGVNCILGAQGDVWLSIYGAYENDQFLINTCGDGSIGGIIDGLCAEFFPNNVLDYFRNLIDIKIENEFNFTKKKWTLDVGLFEKCPSLKK